MRRPIIVRLHRIGRCRQRYPQRSVVLFRESDVVDPHGEAWWNAMPMPACDSVAEAVTAFRRNAYRGWR